MEKMKELKCVRGNGDGKKDGLLCLLEKEGRYGRQNERVNGGKGTGHKYENRFKDS